MRVMQNRTLNQLDPVIKMSFTDYELRTAQTDVKLALKFFHHPTQYPEFVQLTRITRGGVTTAKRHLHD